MITSMMIRLNNSLEGAVIIFFKAKHQVLDEAWFVGDSSEVRHQTGSSQVPPY